MSLHSLSKAPVFLALALASASAQPRNVFASPAPTPTGALLGHVRNAAGTPQMGASVLLYDRYDNLIRRALSTEDGRFAFGALAPDLYTLRVTLASFLPAIRHNISVVAGTESILHVSLATVLSSIDIAPGAPGKATLMTDDWKWVLRSSQSARPVLRFLPVAPPAPKESATLLADTSGVVRLSGGDSNVLNGSLQQDMGTAFAVETAINGGGKVRLSGSFGYGASSGLPSAGFRTTYMRERDGTPGPQISLTARQAYFPAAIGGGSQNAPVLRTASLSTIDSMDLLEGLRLEYGFSMDSIMLYGRMNYFSPFARATYNLGNGGVLKAAFSSGFAPTDLLTRAPEGVTDPGQDLNALAQGPRMSRRDDNAAVERTKSYEVSYQVTDRSRMFAVTAFRDTITNAVYLMSGDIGLAGSANLLPDLNTRGTVFNAGDFQRTGVSASISEALTERLDFLVEGGYAGALTPGAEVIPNALRANIQQTMRPWIMARLDASLPGSGTHLATGYGWMDFRALMPLHQSLTGRSNQQAGWNVSARQPLPGNARFRMEVMAELRNLLAQGYMTLNSPDGRQAVLTNAPRQVRGGVAFIF